MAIMQTYQYYTGLNDIEKVLFGGFPVDSDDYNVIMQGQKKRTITKLKKETVIPVQSLNSSGILSEVYLVKKENYIKLSDKTTGTISKLSPLFNNITIKSITFSGFFPGKDGKMLSVAGVNGDLYITNSTNNYNKIGTLSNYIDNDIKFIMTESNKIYGFDIYGYKNQLSVSFDDNGNLLSISKLDNADIIEDFTIYCLSPTGCYQNFDHSNGITYINEKFEYVLKEYDTSNVEYTISIGTIDIVNPSEDNSSIGSGLVYYYEIIQLTNEPACCALTNTTLDYKDSCIKTINYSYNNRLQLKSTSCTQQMLQQSTKSFDYTQTVENVREYLWESTQPAALEASIHAPALISQSYEKVTQGNVIRYNDKTKWTYDMWTGDTGNKRIYYQKTEKMDGLDGSQWTQTENVNLFSEFGQPYLYEETCPTGMKQGRITKLQYALKTALPIAQFSGMYLNVNRHTAHYLCFEPYAQFLINDSFMSSAYFSASQVKLIDNCFLGSRSLSFKANDWLKITTSFAYRVDKNYVFSCWLKTNGASTWSYFTQVIKGSDLANKQIAYFNAGDCISHIILREVDCIVEIKVYNPDTFHLLGEMDNNGVPTIYINDRLNRQQFSYTAQLQCRTGSESYYDLSEKVAINPLIFSGYSRFNGFNCGKSSIQSNLFNCAIEMIFPKEAITLPLSGGIYSNFNEKTAFIAGPWLTSEQGLLVTRTKDKIEIRFINDTVSLYFDEQLVATSEKYIPDQSAWVVLILDSLVTILVNGKQVLSYMHTVTSSVITEIKTINTITPSITIFKDILVTSKFDFYFLYYDFSGNLIQSQKFRNNRSIISQNFYDRHGNLAAKTLKGAYPLLGKSWLSTDKPLAFRDQFAAIDFSDKSKPNGTISGEIKDFYASSEGNSYTENFFDKDYPYSCYEYEDTSTNRMISSIYPGYFGTNYTDTNSYHDKSTYQDYVKDYTKTENINYLSNLKKYLSTGSKSQRTASQLFDLSGNQYGFKLLCKSDISSLPISQIMETEIGITLSEKLGSPSFYQNHYTNREQSFNTSKTISTANRIVLSSSEDFGEREILYDSLGNARLAKASSEPVFKYSKYDIHGRVLELGTIKFTTTYELKEYIDKVNNPSFPTSEDGTITPIYQFVYDNLENKTNHFKFGRLCMIKNVPSNHIIYYDYNFLGYTTTYQYTSELQKTNSLLNYSYDFAGNILSIIYPSTFGLTTEYSYNDFAKPEKIVLKKADGSNPIIIIDNATYDIFDQLAGYTNAQDKKVIRNWSAFGHLKTIGEKNLSCATTKTYFNYLEPDNPNLINIYDSNNKSTLQLDYNAINQLSLFQTQTTDGKNINQSFSYDSHGNLLQTYDNLTDKSITMEYDSAHRNQLIKVKDETAKVLASITYDNDGFMTQYNSTSNLTFTKENYYSSKAQKVASPTDEKEYSYTFDYLGRKSTSTYQKNELIYGYGFNSQLTYSIANGSYGKNALYIFCEDELVAEYNSHTNQIISLMYDNMATLRYVSYIDKKIVQSRAVEYTSPWGEPNGYGTLFPKVTFLYAGMEYLEEINAYDNDGKLYFPQYGITNTPSLGMNFHTPYRIYGNVPIR